MSEKRAVTFDDYERTKRHSIGGYDAATRAHMAVSRAISAFGDNPTTGTRGHLLGAIHAYADRVSEERMTAPLEPSEEAVKALFRAIYPNTAWNPYQDSNTIECHRAALRAAYAAERLRSPRD